MPSKAPATPAKKSKSKSAAEPVFSSIDEVLADIRAGKMVVITDDADRENEGDLICAADKAEALWNALLDAGVAACGLGSRDTLRVEAGLPLYGHELEDHLSPIAAGLGWVVSKTKQFVGSDIINAARANGTKTKLHGIQLKTKRLIAPGMKVYVDEEEVGEVSSGVVSPLLDTGLAFGFLRSDVKLGTECEIDVRGKREPGTVVSKRFFKRA